MMQKKFILHFCVLPFIYDSSCRKTATSTHTETDTTVNMTTEVKTQRQTPVLIHS